MEEDGRLRIVTARDSTALTIFLTGDLDPATTPELQAAIEVARTPADRAVILDLAAIEFIDSAGLRGLVETHRRLEDDEVGLTLRRPSRIVLRLLEITALDTVLPIEH